MTHRIPEEIIEEIRLRSDIVETISEYVSLQRKGKVYLGLCPFHSEKTPSFTVSPDKQMFYCFGCHTGGNVFTFLMKKENRTFLETVQELAQKHGITLPEKELSPHEREEQKHRLRWGEIHEWASRYFQEKLISDKEGSPARAYFERRGIDTDTVKNFRLGYAPDHWDGLLKYMQQLGVGPEELVDAGLALEREKAPGQFYDRFRNRIIFSITNLRGEVIAFGGRVLDDSLPKYLNSPETAFFNKGHNLYGLHNAYQSIRQKGYAILVEGYMDGIAVQRAGFTNAVASLGTALTKDQARLLRRFTRRIILAYDADSAGVAASLRAGEILQNSGLNVNVLEMGEGKDPDEFIKLRGSAAFREALEKAKTYIEFKYLVLAKETPPHLIRDKAALVENLAPDIAKVESPVEREGYERFLSFELGLTLDAVQREIENYSQKIKHKAQNNEYYSKKQDISVKKRDNIDMSVNFPPVSAVPIGIYKAERLLLRILMENPSLHDKASNAIGDDFWHMPEHEMIYRRILSQGKAGIDKDALLGDLPPEAQSEFAGLMMEDMDLSSPEHLLDDCMHTIHSLQKEESVEELQTRMADLEKSGNMAEAMALLKEIGERLKGG